MKLSNISQQTIQNIQTKQLTLLNQTQEHAAKQHNHCQSNQDRKIQNKHINNHNKPKQPSHQQSITKSK